MPCKFDDLPKVASEVLNDDYQSSGYVFKAKQKTNYKSAVLSTQVDLLGGGCATPAKLTWKLPKPFNLDGVSVDKLEMDKAGKFKLEASASKLHPGLVVDCKSDLKDASKITAGATYTGLKGTQFKFECPALNPQAFTSEFTCAGGIATVGAKASGASLLKGGAPDFGMRLQDGPYFCALLAKEQFSTVNASVCYQVNPDLKAAATYQLGGKANGSFAVATSYKGKCKMKLAHDQTFSASYKHALAKGFTVLGGASYNVQKGNFSYGCQLSVE